MKKTKNMQRVAYRKKIHIRLDDDLHRKLRMKVANENTTIQTYITDLLRRSLG
jgi:hypothetical protein